MFTGTAPTASAAYTALRVAQALAERGELRTRREVRLAAEEQAAVEAARITVGAYLPIRLERRSVRVRTRVGYKGAIRLHLIPALGTVPLADLTARDVRGMLEGLAAPGPDGRVRTAATLIRVRSVLSGALSAAVEDGLVPYNVARGLRIPERAARRQDGRISVFTSAQLDAFLTRADAQGVGEIMRFIAATGVRRGEAVAVRWEDVDLEAGLVMIRRSIVQPGSRFIEGTPKTRRSERVIPLDQESAERLRVVSRWQVAERLRWGTRGGTRRAGYSSGRMAR